MGVRQAYRNFDPIQVNHMRWLLLITLCIGSWLASSQAADEDVQWLIGKWQLVYDPDGASTDYLVFKENGDLISISEHGEFHGFYMVVPGAIRGVLSNNGKDLLLTFFYNSDKTQLRIVTSASGIESIYEKVPD